MEKNWTIDATFFWTNGFRIRIGNGFWIWLRNMIRIIEAMDRSNDEMTELHCSWPLFHCHDENDQNNEIERIFDKRMKNFSRENIWIGLLERRLYKVIDDVWLDTIQNSWWENHYGKMIKHFTGKKSQSKYELHQNNNRKLFKKKSVRTA